MLVATQVLEMLSPANVWLMETLARRDSVDSIARLLYFIDGMRPTTKAMAAIATMAH